VLGASDLKTILRISTAITSVPDLDRVLRKACEAAVELFGVDHSALLLFESTFECGMVRAEYPQLEPRGERIQLRGVPAEERLIQSKLPLVIPDVASDESLGSVREVLLRFGISSTMFVPVVIKNQVVGSFSLDSIGNTHAFTPEEVELCEVFAAQVAVAIENAQLFRQVQEQKANLEHRQKRLRQLDEASLNIRPPEEEKVLLQEIVRLAVELVDGTVGVLYIHHPDLEQLELGPSYKPRQPGRRSPRLMGWRIGKRVLRSDGLGWQVADSGQMKIINDYNKWPHREAIFEEWDIETAVGVPLKIVGDVAGVLFVGKHTEGGPLTEQDDEIEILRRFANSASLAWQTSRLTGQAAWNLALMTILHRISDYAQRANDLDKVLHVVLNGITAGCGLGFNRAVLLLLDDRNEHLVGKIGIGEVVEKEAREAWELALQHGLRDTSSYIAWIESNPVPQTPIGKITPGLRFRVAGSGDESRPTDAFSEVIDKKRCRIIKPHELSELPEDFQRYIKPASDVVVMPLKVRNNVIGLLVADNKFTLHPVSDDRVGSLREFGNTAAIAIDNARLRREAEVGRERLQSLFEASSALVSSQNPAEVLDDIVERARVAAEAAWVRMILVDETGKPSTQIVKGTDAQLDLSSAVRPDGISMGVIRSGKAEVIEDVSGERHRVSPLQLEHGVGATVCLPLSLQGKQIGVLWVNYSKPRQFSKWEIQALQLYANQAAKAYADAQRKDDDLRRLLELESMHDAAKAMARASGLDQVLQTITEKAKTLFEADSTAIWPYDNGLGKFIPNQLVATGIPDSVLRTFKKIEPAEGGITYTIFGSELVYVSDVASPDAEFIRPEIYDLLRGADIRSFQGITLKAGEEPVGVLYVSYRECRIFSEEDGRRLRNFATHAALALKKARLLDQVEKAKEAAYRVARVTALGAGDLKHTLHLIAQETQKLLNCGAVVLYVYDEVTGKLDHPPTMLGVEHPDRASRFREVAPDSLVYKVVEKFEKEDEPYVVESPSDNDLFRASRFAQDEKIQTCVAVPLKAKAQRVGVMFVNYRSPHRLLSDEEANIRLFAHQAAIAIANVQLHESVKRRARALEAIHAAGVAVTGTLELNEILGRIAAQGWKLAGSADDPNGFVSIWLTDTLGTKLVAAHPPETLSVALQSLENAYFIPEKLRRIGVIGRVVRTGASQLVLDVDNDGDFVRLFPAIRQQLAVPITISNEVIGVISVEHPKHGALEDRDRESLECLAAQAAVAIQNARRFEDLRGIKGYVGSRTALEWMKIVSHAWAHNIRREVGTALLHIELIERRRREGNVTEELTELRNLERTINRIRDIPIIAPLSAEDKVDDIQINDLLKTYLGRLWEHARYSSVKLHYDLEKELDTVGVVRGSRAWIRQVLEILVDNAVEAMLMTDRPQRELTVSTRARGGKVEVSIRDTGPGIPTDFLERIFEMPKAKPRGSRGAGIGLILADTIVRTYGGEIHVGSTGAEGTTMVVLMPMHNPADGRHGGISA
jgi:GAF domain-containing protein/anti-sigma regulatory factor (Ser/Thr protein kinase)